MRSHISLNDRVRTEGFRSAAQHDCQRQSISFIAGRCDHDANSSRCPSSTDHDHLLVSHEGGFVHREQLNPNFADYARRDLKGVSL